MSKSNLSRRNACSGIVNQVRAEGTEKCLFEEEMERNDRKPAQRALLYKRSPHYPRKRDVNAIVSCHSPGFCSRPPSAVIGSGKFVGV